MDVIQQVLCSQADEYNRRGVLCDASHEGPLRRNPGNHNRNVVARLPTAAEVEFTLNMANYDTGAMDRTSNMSFRNTLEGQLACQPAMSYSFKKLVILKWNQFFGLKMDIWHNSSWYSKVMQLTHQCISVKRRLNSNTVESCDLFWETKDVFMLTSLRFGCCVLLWPQASKLDSPTAESGFDSLN